MSNTSSVFSNKDLYLLYHGSKSGINGRIIPNSRPNCDFGKGFYMGDIKQQALTLISGYAKSKLYKLSLNIEGLKVLRLNTDIEWALLVAYNRGKLQTAKCTKLYSRISSLSDGYDIVIGPIADDRMFLVLDRFFNGDVIDIALVSSLTVLNLGNQFVAKTQKACNNINILEETALLPEEQLILQELSERNRLQGIQKTKEVCRKYRREGMFFDEILQRGDY